MLKVTIANIDSSFHGVFDTDDKQKAAEMAVASLVAEHAFFVDCRAFECVSDDPSGESAWGIVVNDGFDEADLEYEMESENTHWIYIAPFVPNKMFGSY